MRGTLKLEYASGMAKTRQISFRLPEEEYRKIATVYANAKERTLGYAPLGDVVREAIGLIPLKVITQIERDYLSGKVDRLPGEKKHGPFRPVNDLGPGLPKNTGKKGA